MNNLLSNLFIELSYFLADNSGGYIDNPNINYFEDFVVKALVIIIVLLIVNLIFLIVFTLKKKK